MPLICIALGVLIVLINFLIGNIRVPRDDPFFMLPFVVPLGIVAFYGWFLMSIPYRIAVDGNRQVTFKSFLKSRSVSAYDMLSIEPGGGYMTNGFSWLVVKCREGNIRFFAQFTDQYLLLYELKQANPGLELKGC